MKDEAKQRRKLIESMVSIENQLMLCIDNLNSANTDDLFDISSSLVVVKSLIQGIDSDINDSLLAAKAALKDSALGEI